MSNDEEIFFKWSPDYSVNIKTIDDQHKVLVDILNCLFVAVGKREGDKAIAGILEALMGYTQKHFTLEENLMRQAKYPELESHMEEHRKLIKELDILTKKYMLEDKPIYFEMLKFLKTWLRAHIQGVDKKYSTTLREAGFSVDAWEKEATAEFTAMSNSKKWWELWK